MQSICPYFAHLKVLMLLTMNLCYDLIYQGVYQIQQLPNGQQVYIQQTEVDHSEQDGS